VLHAETLPRQLAIGWIAGALASAAGLAASYALDLPTGATMVCCFGAALALAGVVHVFRRGGARIAFVRIGLAARALVGAALIGSGVLLMAAPRADQPLLDAVEALLPATRDLYLSGIEAAVYREAEGEAARHAGEATRLNALETQSRAGGDMDEMT